MQTHDVKNGLLIDSCFRKVFRVNHDPLSNFGEISPKPFIVAMFRTYFYLRSLTRLAHRTHQ